MDVGKKVVGTVYKPRVDGYFIILVDGTKIRVNEKEYRKMKRRLASGYENFINVNMQSTSVESEL